MASLLDIQTQIEKLQKQASEIKDREFDSTVQDILTKMQAFGITIKDLQRAGSAGRRGKTKGKATAGSKSTNTKAQKTSTVVAAKYRGPNGESWSGRGLTPRWLSALLAEGKTKEEFAI